MLPGKIFMMPHMVPCNMNGPFPFDESYHLRYGIFGWYGDQHMNMIRDDGSGSLVCLPVLHNKSCLRLRRAKSKDFDLNSLRFLKLVTDGFATGIILHRIYHQLTHSETQRLTLGRFFSAQVKEKILSTKENLRLGGERKKVTILFADLEGFTSMSEKSDHEKVVEILNLYFSLMTPIIFQYNGTLRLTDLRLPEIDPAFSKAPICSSQARVTPNKKNYGHSDIIIHSDVKL